MSKKHNLSISLTLPSWVESMLPEEGRTFDSAEERMQYALGLARENVRQKTGGPFGAAVFDLDSGKLIAPGVNVVVASSCSSAHAEMMAMSLAQQELRTHDLGGEDMPRCELVTSAEPCAMCLGAIPWSGVRRVLCGARDEDVRAVGFDEGAKPAGWITDLQSRGIEVVRDVCRAEAADVLGEYKSSGGEVYNGRSGKEKTTDP
ncbi:tRNA-specific adenosine deaminase [Oceaniferula spumae]|uniref:tRNA-specific adenosine deaminase n=1 Tax=Oceaniferula spumae TaxID=2979115 RepID=A0AAT9FM79_9BACT